MFRDEGVRVAHKARKRLRSAREESPSADTQSLGPHRTVDIHRRSDSSPLHAAERPQHPPHQPIGSVGAEFFFAKYCCADSSYFDLFYSWMSEIYQSETSRGSSPICLAIQAVGLAGIANINASPESKSASSQHYQRAIIAINTAVSEPDSRRTDATFMAVMLLGFCQV